jgi:hypothetical protein
VKPIPLSAPDGRVYAYACGYCHHVGGGSQVPGGDVGGPEPREVSGSLGRATRCCTCRCGAQRSAPDPDDDGYSRILYTCSTCRWWQGWTATWQAIGVCVQHGLTSRAALDAWWRAENSDLEGCDAD